MQTVAILNVSNDIQAEIGVNYFFDAITRMNLSLKTTYSSYPIDFGADVQDHAYNLPDEVVIYGYTGSNELRFTQNILPQLATVGQSAILNRIDNPFVSAAAGIAADFGFSASAAFQAGSDKTRGMTTFEFLKTLKESFSTFTLQTGLQAFPKMKIDTIESEVNTENETGLEFVVTLSQLRTNDAINALDVNVSNLPDTDPARTMGAAIVRRGRVALG